MNDRSSSTATRGRNAAILGFGIFLVFAALRYLIYDLVPVTTFFDWFLRDTLVNGPRLLALGLALLLGVRVWGREGLGLHARGGRTAVLVFLSFFLLLWLPDPWSRSNENPLGIPALLVLAASSVLVGSWEEMFYRGVFLNAIRDWKGTRAAIWGSSFLFTIMHVQAHPIASWPGIFLCGVLFATMRLEGVGLLWLIAIHAAFDALAVAGPTGPESIPGLSLFLLLLRGSYVALYYRRHQHKKDTECVAPLSVPDADPPPVLQAEPEESEERKRLRVAFGIVESRLKQDGPYRIRLHITKLSEVGEMDLGPWPDVVAQVSQFDAAADFPIEVGQKIDVSHAESPIDWARGTSQLSGDVSADL